MSGSPRAPAGHVRIRGSGARPNSHPKDARCTCTCQLQYLKFPPEQAVEHTRARRRFQGFVTVGAATARQGGSSFSSARRKATRDTRCGGGRRHVSVAAGRAGRAQTTRTTSAGHQSVAGADPAGYSATPVHDRLGPGPLWRVGQRARARAAAFRGGGFRRGSLCCRFRPRQPLPAGFKQALTAGLDPFLAAVAGLARLASADSLAASVATAVVPVPAAPGRPPERRAAPPAVRASFELRRVRFGTKWACSIASIAAFGA